MTQRTVAVRLTMETAEFIRRAREAGQVGEDAMSQIESRAGSTSQAIEGIGTAAGVAAAGGLAALLSTGKAAMDWESDWTSVTKTVSGSAEEIAAVEVGLRDLAKTLPATHSEITGVAAAAGALGVATGDVVSFTDTMIALGVSVDDLSAEDAATAIAQITNVMGTGAEDVERFASTLVTLGNNGASTEGEILSMAQRLAGAGKLVGASEGEVLALANALASMGVEAQLGGGVMSRTMTSMYSDAQEGGKAWKAWADIAGQSAQDFAREFESSPIKAIDSVTQGLSRIDKEGGNVVEALKSVGIEGTEDLQVLLRLKGGGDMLTDSLNMQAEAWEANTALAAEAGARYGTTESQISVAWNNIRDAGIEAGEALLPLAADLAEDVAGVAQAFGSLGDDTQAGIGRAVFAMTGAAGMVWASTKVVGATTAMIGGYRDLSAAVDMSTRSMMIARGAALGAGGLIAGMSTMADESTMTGAAIETMGLTAGGALMGFGVGGPIGAAVGGGIGLIAGLGKAMLATGDSASESAPEIEELAAHYDHLAGAASRANREIALQALNKIDAGKETLGNVGLTQQDAILASLGDEKALRKVQRALRQTREQAELLGDEFGTQLADHANRAQTTLEKLGVSVAGVRAESISAALAVGDWKAEFPGIPKRVLTEMSTSGVPESKAEVEELLGQFKLTEKERRAVFKLLGVEYAKKEAQDASRELDKAAKPRKASVDASGVSGAASKAKHLDGALTTATRGRNIFVTTSGAAAAEGILANVARPRNAVITVEQRVMATNFVGPLQRGQVRRADGGTIPGQREPYGDKVLAYLAPGEEVITNRNGEADRFRADRASGRIPAYANGGTVGAPPSSWSRRGETVNLDGTWMSFDKAVKRLENRFDSLDDTVRKHQATVEDWRQKMETVGSVATGHFAPDLFAVDELNPWTMSRAPSADPLGAVQGSNKGLRERIALQTRLDKAGLSGGAFEAIAAGSNDQISSFLASGNVRRFQREYETYERLDARAGRQAGRIAYGDDLGAAVKELKAARVDRAQGNKTLKSLQRTVEKWTKDNDDIAGDVARGVNKAGQSGTGTKVKRRVG